MLYNKKCAEVKQVSCRSEYKYVIQLLIPLKPYLQLLETVPDKKLQVNQASFRLHHMLCSYVLDAQIPAIYSSIL